MIAVIRKVAITLLSNKNVRKLLGGVVAGILVIIIMPISAILTVFQDDRFVNVPKLQERVIDGLSSEEMHTLQLVYDKTVTLDIAMTEAGFAERKQEAQVLFVLALSAFSEEEGFVRGELRENEKGLKCWL